VVAQHVSRATVLFLGAGAPDLYEAKVTWLYGVCLDSHFRELLAIKLIAKSLSVRSILVQSFRRLVGGQANLVAHFKSTQGHITLRIPTDTANLFL
jgi:hypothetical protein